MHQIRIAHVLPSFDVGGLENGVVNLINTMDKTQYSHDLYILTGEGSACQRLNDDVFVRFMRKAEGNDMLLPFRLARHFRRRPPEIVRTYGWGAWIEGMLAAWLSGRTAVVHSEHGYALDRGVQRHYRRKVAQYIAAHLTPRVVVVSDALRHYLEQQVGIPSQKITTIVNGVDTHRFHPAEDIASARQNLGIDESEFVIGTVARLEAVKDIGTALRAISEMGLRDVRYLIVGDGPERSVLQDLAQRLDIEKQVIFVGERADVAELYRCMDIYMLTSIREGTSNTLLEAMASGVPVIATDVGGNRLIVEDGVTGRLVPPGGVGEIAAILKCYKSNAEGLKKMAVAARQVVEKQYGIDRMVSDYDRLYMGIVVRKGTSR